MSWKEGEPRTKIKNLKLNDKTRGPKPETGKPNPCHRFNK